MGKQRDEDVVLRSLGLSRQLLKFSNVLVTVSEGGVFFFFLFHRR